MTSKHPFQSTKARGAQTNEVGRFESLQREEDFSHFEHLIDGEEKTLLKTQIYKDKSKSILSENNSPDLGFRFGLNPYRGCEHGCAYCYARPTHEYLGFSAGLDFESKLFVKENAPQLLREKFMSKSWKPEVIMVSGITDCYQPIERRFEITRKCLEVFAEFRNPVGMITKNALVNRDIDILSDLARHDCAMVFLSITSLDPELTRKLEPRTSSPRARLEAVENLAKAGIAVGINIAPVIPSLNEHEIPNILRAGREAGATVASYVPLRLPYSVKDLFSEWLENHYPLKKEKVLSALRSIRQGRLNDSGFGSRMQGCGVRADQIAQVFNVFHARYGYDKEGFKFSTHHFRRPGEQLTFDLT